MRRRVSAGETHQERRTGPAEAAAMRRSLTTLRVGLDAVSTALAAATALFLRFGLGLLEVTESTDLTLASHAVPAAAWVGTALVTFAGHRLYDEDALVVGSGEMQRISRSLIQTAGIFAIFVFVSQSFQVSRAWFALTLLLSLLFLWLERRVFRAYLQTQRRRGRWRRRILLIVPDRDANEESLRDIDEFEIVRALTPEALSLYLLQEHVRDEPKPSLLIHDADFDRNEMWRLVMDAGRRGITSYVLSPLRSVRRDRLTVRELSGNTIVKVAPAGLRGAEAILKRSFDLTFGTVLLILSAPVIAIAAVVVRSTSGSPIFYRQTRVGMEGRLFSIVKLRTMRIDSEPDGPVWSTTHDPRVTKVGRWLRRSGIDELPQLFNVIRGDMSLVGPRPERPEFVEKFSHELVWYGYRDRLRPGITGWAQAHGLRGNTSLESRIDMDNWYIENWSLLLDVRILLGTVIEVIRGESEEDLVNSR